MKTLHVISLVALTFLSQFTADAIVVNCSWGSSPGNWEDPLGWECGKVPSNNATNDFNVSIGVIPVDGVRLSSGKAIFHITVLSGSKLYFTNGANLFIENFPNAMTGYPEQELAIGGGLTFQNTNGNATLSLSRGAMTLRGFGGIGGTITLANSGSVIDGITANTTDDTQLFMTEGTTIRGAGQITDMALFVNPFCQIFADNNATLKWQANTIFFNSTNQGLLQASGSNSVFILDGTTGAGLHVLHNEGGLISGIAGGAVELQHGFTIIGGDLSTSGTGRIRGGGVLQDITLDGSSHFDVTASHLWRGTIENRGEFTIKDGNVVTIDGSLVTLTGGGSVLLSTNPGIATASSAIWPVNSTLRNVDNLIHGQGYIDGSIGASGVLDNQGRIEADAPGQLFQQYLWIRPYVDAGVAVNWTNSGVIRANNGGFLWLGAGGANYKLDNTGGLIACESNSNMRIFGTRIYNGTISANDSNAVIRLSSSELHNLTVTTTNGGLLAIADLGSGVSARLDHVFNRGNIIVSNACTLYLDSDLTNAGHIFFDPDATSSTDISLTSDLTLSGGGDIELKSENRSFLNTSGGAWKLINADNTIHGSGRIQSVSLVNQGIVDADATTPLFFNLPVFGPWTNNGTVRATGTGGFEVNDPLLVNLGTVQIADGSHVGTSGGIRQDAGKLIVNGSISNQFASAFVLLNAGTLRGSGLILGNVTNASGIVSPGFSLGRLTIAGNFTQQSNGVLSVEIGGTSPGVTYDQLVASFFVKLGGTLNVSFTNNFTPSANDTFEIVTGGPRVGTFDTGGGFVANNGVVLVPRYSATNVVLIVATNLPPLLQPVYAGALFKFNFQTTSGFSYQAQYTDSLNPPIEWHDFSGPFLGDGNLIVITNMPLPSPQRFYRIRYQ